LSAFSAQIHRAKEMAARGVDLVYLSLMLSWQHTVEKLELHLSLAKERLLLSSSLPQRLKTSYLTL
jgi:hypothetical protein